MQQFSLVFMINIEYATNIPFYSLLLVKNMKNSRFLGNF